MKNWIQPGDIVTVVAPAILTSGSGFMVGALFGVASSDAATGDNVEMAVTGVVDLPKAAVAITQGAKVYWISATNNVTTTAAGNTLIGCAIVAAAIGDSTVRVRLNGVVA